MQKTILYAMLVLLLAANITSLAYAEEDISNAGLEEVVAGTISSTITIAGTGAVAGAILSVVRVMGKYMKEQKPEGFAFNKFLITTIVGGVVGAALGYLGVGLEAAMGIDFMVVYFLSQTVFPMMQERKWKVK